MPLALVGQNSTSLAASIEGDRSLQFADCRVVEGGTVTHGLLGAVLSLQAIAKELQSEVVTALAAQSAIGDLGTDENRERVLRMAALESPHMRDAYALALENMDSDVYSRLENTQRVVMIVTWVFAAAFSITVAIYYWPEAGVLQEQLQSARELLTLVPEEVQEVVVPLRRGLHVIASKQDTGEQGLPGLSSRGWCSLHGRRLGCFCDLR